MSTIAASDVGSPDASGLDPQPRVRHLAREAVVLMTFSATTSLAVAGCLLILTALGRQG